MAGAHRRRNDQDVVASSDATVGTTANQSLQLTPLAERAIIDPGAIGGPPSDSIVLFDGKDLSHWNNVKGGEAKWLLKDGVMTVVSHSGSIATKRGVGDVQTCS
jgi:hypothetical protein